MIRQKLRKYELIYLVQPEATDEERAKITERVEQAFEKFENARVLRKEDWGKRKLAYEVKGQLKGIYLYWRYLGNAGTVDELERNLRMQDAVIRYYTVKVDEDVLPDARPTEVTDETWAKAATTGPDEEEIVTGQAPRFASDDDEDDYVAPGAEAILAEIPPEEKALLEKPPVKEEV